MNLYGDANNGSTNTLKKLKDRGLAFTNVDFMTAVIGRGANDLENVALFIEAGMDVNAPIEGSLPIVVLAGCISANCEIAQLLLNNGAHVDAVGKSGITAMQLAIALNHKALVTLLIENGADVNCETGVGKPLDWALRNAHAEIGELLTAHGAIPSETPEPDKVFEITHLVERLELLEEKFGISISGVYASCIYELYSTPPHHSLKINFEVTSLSGGKLEQDIRVNASAYNSGGQLLGNSFSYVFSEHFLGFSPQSIRDELHQRPAKIRLFPSSMHG